LEVGVYKIIYDIEHIINTSLAHDSKKIYTYLLGATGKQISRGFKVHDLITCESTDP